MGIYRRARSIALGVACASGLVAGAGMAVAPGSALAAKVNCVAITGSGSSLQSEQQKTWEEEVNPLAFKLKTKPDECEAFGPPKVTYTATGSGQGLLEFGIIGKVLLKMESGNKVSLDAFVGTDDPPNLAEMKEAEEASGSKPVVMPIVAAPVAIIVHLPKECLLIREVGVTNANLSKVFANEAITWEELLGAGNVESKDMSKVACKASPMVDVRFDGSGTSFALKQYLCQVNKTLWGKTGQPCESGQGFVTDASTWPNEAVGPPEVPLRKHKAGVTENKGSAGVVEAVEEEEGSIGYVNLANAAKGMFVLSKEDAELFWVNLEALEEGVAAFFDPLLTAESSEVAQAHCSTNFKIEPAAVKTEAEEGMWENVHLGNPDTSGAYPLCTFTYDVGWENYLTTKLTEAENYGANAELIGNTALGYFEYMANKNEGQAKIASDYTKLPTEVIEVAEKLAEKLKN